MVKCLVCMGKGQLELNILNEKNIYYSKMFMGDDEVWATELSTSNSLKGNVSVSTFV